MLGYPASFENRLFSPYGECPWSTDAMPSRLEMEEDGMGWDTTQTGHAERVKRRVETEEDGKTYTL